VLHGCCRRYTRWSAGSAGGLRLAVTLDRLLRADPPCPPATDPAPGGAAPPPTGADLVLRGVTFRYGPQAEPVLTDLDLAWRRAHSKPPSPAASPSRGSPGDSS
jgi:hypothetical protein